MDFKEFLAKYIAEQKKRHKDNVYWQTDKQVIDNLGGIDQIESVYYIAINVSKDAQERILGFAL